MSVLGDRNAESPEKENFSVRADDGLREYEREMRSILLADLARTTSSTCCHNTIFVPLRVAFPKYDTCVIIREYVSYSVRFLAPTGSGEGRKYNGTAAVVLIPPVPQSLPDPGPGRTGTVIKGNPLQKSIRLHAKLAFL
jgi:hypothetical protein